MSDARWLDVADDVAAAVLHFTRAGELYADGRFGAADRFKAVVNPDSG